MGIESINEPGSGRTWMVLPKSINEPVFAPVVTDMTPTTAAIGDPSFDLVFTGTGFDPFTTFIAFAGQREPARFNEDGTIYTIVDMNHWHGPDVVKAAVYNGDQPSQEFDFTFTAAATGETRKAHTADPDDIEDEIEQEIEDGDIKPLHPPRKKRR